MQVRLLSCAAPRPDRRAIAAALAEYALLDPSEAAEQTGFLIEGSEIELDISDAATSSAFRAFRKYGVEYEIVED